MKCKITDSKEDLELESQGVMVTESELNYSENKSEDIIEIESENNKSEQIKENSEEIKEGS